MKSQLKFSSVRIGHLVSAIFLLIVLSLFVAPSVQACHKGVPHGKHTCDPDPNPGPNVPDNMVLWGGGNPLAGVMEESARLCTLDQIASDSSTGNYSCELNSEHIIYDFQWMGSEPIHRRGDDWRCAPGRMEYIVDPDITYSFNWAGDCTGNNGCAITVVNAFSNYGIPGGSVSRITVEGFGSVAQTGANPFFDEQPVSIDYLHVTIFSKKGNDKVLAICKLTPHPDHPVTFDTSPVPAS